MRAAESILDALVRLTAETGSHPTEMTFPSSVFLNAAADMQGLGFHRAALAGCPIRVAYAPTGRVTFLSNTVSMEKNDGFREVAVGDSFVIQGPCGPVTIREAKEK